MKKSGYRSVTQKMSLNLYFILLFTGCLFHLAKGQSLVDPNATEATKKYFRYLKSIGSEKILFGQHHATFYGIDGGLWKDSVGDQETSDVKLGTGSHPAIIEYDFKNTYGGTEGWNGFRAHAIKSYQRGGLLIFSWHARNPVTGGDWHDKEGLPARKILPGGELHEKFRGWLTHIGEFFKSLEVDGFQIPVIFRPWLENSADYFWWGPSFCTEQEFIELWRFTVEYLRDTMQVHNLLYAYSPSKPGQYGGYGPDGQYLLRYPGDDYVDILGLDFYGKENIAENLLPDARFVVQLAEEKGKIPALTEFGYRKGLQDFKGTEWWVKSFLKPLKNDPIARKMAFAVTWSNKTAKQYWVPARGYPTYGDFVKFYEDPFTVFEDDLAHGVYHANAADFPNN